MNIGIIGGGEVGRAYAEALASGTEHRVTVSTPRPTPAMVAIADANRIPLATAAGPWLAEMDRIWLCVTGDVASSVCAELLDHIKPGAVIVDLTTATPESKRSSFHLATDRGVGYVDAVILGAVALTGARTPLLAAGAEAADTLREFVALGAPVRTLPEAQAGDAAALKLLRTILTKGLEALAVECLVAAQQQGVRADLYEAMTDVDAIGFTNFLDMLVTTHIQHATRRLAEVERAEAQLAGMGFHTSMLAASQLVFTRTTEATGRQTPPVHATKDVTAALTWLGESSAERNPESPRGEHRPSRPAERLRP